MPRTVFVLDRTSERALFSSAMSSAVALSARRARTLGHIYVLEGNFPVCTRVKAKTMGQSVSRWWFPYLESVTFRRGGTGEVFTLLCSCAASPAQSEQIRARSHSGSVHESCLFSQQKPHTSRGGAKPPSLTGAESDSGGDQWWQAVVEARAMRQPLDRVQAVSAAIPRGSRSPCSTSPPSCSDGHQVANAGCVISDDHASLFTTSSEAFGDCCTLGVLEQMVHSGLVTIGLRCLREAL